MIKTIYFDCNFTLEDFKSIKDNQAQILRNVISNASKKSINIELIKAKEHILFLEKNFSSDAAWINHPIFWRGLIKTKSQKDINTLYYLYLKEYIKTIKLYPETIKVLSELKSRNIQLFLIANGNDERLRKLIEYFKFSEYFEDYLISGECPYSKPHNFAFNYFIKKYKLNASEVLMVGDRYENDILGAKECNIKTALIQRDNDVEQAKTLDYNPDFVISNLNSLIDIIDLSRNRQLYYFSDKLLKIENPIKTAVILAGGKGRRLGKLGEKVNKTMLKISDRSILEILITKFKCIGVKRFIIPISHLSQQIKEYFGDGGIFNVRIEYINLNLPSTSDVLLNILEKLDESFYYCHGNIIFQNYLLSQITHDFIQYNLDVVTCSESINSIQHKKFVAQNNYIVKKSDRFLPNFTYLGLSIYKRETLKKYLKPHNMVEEFIDEAIEDNIKVRCLLNKGYYQHIETVNDYEIAKEINI